MSIEGCIELCHVADFHIPTPEEIAQEVQKEMDQEIGEIFRKQTFIDSEGNRQEVDIA